MQLLTTNEINTRYDKGLAYITNITYNKFVKDSYAVQFRSTNKDNNLLLLMFAADSWDNREGADNILSPQQFAAILDQIAYAHRDSLSNSCSTQSPAECGCQESQGCSFAVIDSESIHLSYVNGILSASLQISGYTGNTAVIRPDGLYTEGGNGQPSIKVYFTGNNFNVGTNVYDNITLAGLTDFVVWHRGLGFLLYNFDDTNDPTNEFRILGTGGIEIIIPGFDVHDGNNYFYILT